MSKNVFFASDHHFCHKNLISYCNRPYSSVQEMNEALIENHNKIVKPQDLVYFLGDFAFCRADETKKILARINGEKHFIHGNHDKDILKHKYDFLNMDNGFKTIQPYKEINVGSQFICLFHYGQRVWNRSHHGSWMLFGHSHGSLPPYGKSVDVGVDAKFIHDEYRPTHFDELKAFMDKRSKASEDYHE